METLKAIGEYFWFLVGEYLWFLVCYFGKSKLHRIIDNPRLTPEEIIRDVNKRSTIHGHFATPCKSIKPRNSIYSELVYDSTYCIWKWPNFEQRTQEEKRKLKKKFS